MEVMIHTTAVSVPINIWEEVELYISSGLIKVFKFIDTTPLVEKKARNRFRVCSETKEAGKFIEGNIYM